MQRIVILEKSWEEAESLCEALKKAFPAFTIDQFMNFGDFLIFLSEKSAEISLIITEDRLALMEPRVNGAEWKANLRKDFPEVIENWKGSKVPETLMRHLDSKGYEIPVIFYTHSYRDWISPEALNHPRAVFLMKDVPFRPLISQADELLAVRA